LSNIAIFCQQVGFGCFLAVGGATSQRTKGGIQSLTPLCGGKADAGENHEPDATKNRL